MLSDRLEIYLIEFYDSFHYEKACYRYWEHSINLIF